MSTVTQAREAIEKLQGSLITIAGECMMEHSDEITGLLRHQQYDEGVDSSNTPLRQYSRTTRLLKQQAGTYTGYTNLHETGEFHSTLMLRVNGDEFEVESPSRTDQGELKSEWLRRWNRSPIMDFTPDNLKLIYPIIEDTFRERVNNELALD